MALYQNKGLDENYCRNTDAYRLGIWCYALGVGAKWELCDVVPDPTTIPAIQNVECRQKAGQLVQGPGGNQLYTDGRTPAEYSTWKFCGMSTTNCPNKVTCASPPTCSATQILSTDFCQCFDCKEYTRPQTAAGVQTCAANACTDKQKVLPDGTCVDCPDYQKSMPWRDKRFCKLSVCDGKHKLVTSGECVKCLPYTKKVISVPPVLTDGYDC